ncbi:MAG TPA: PAS domain-containing sensor histidine kinase [Bacteroidales bacterium]|nr:PAS domain-containing sensor histidine kinase [Bacteroidales bacterium]
MQDTDKSSEANTLIKTPDAYPPTQDRYEDHLSAAGENALINTAEEQALLLAEQKRRYNEILKNEGIQETFHESFEDLFYYAPVPYFVLDNEARIIQVNLSGSKIMHLDMADLINSNFRRFVAQNDLPVFGDLFGEVLSTGYPHSAAFTLLTPENNEVVVHAQCIASKENNNCYLTLLDITTQKNDEDKLRTIATRYKRLFESAKDGLLIMDAENCQVIDVNSSLIAMLGSSYDELLGKKLWEFDVFANDPVVKDALLELQVNGYVKLDDVAIDTPEGPIIAEIVSNAFMIENKKMIQCDIRNVTDRKKTEQTLRDSVSKLRETNSHKDKFFSIIAHDLRRPFGCIIGYSNLLAEYVHERKFEKVEEYAAVVQNSSWRALDLLMNLIEWSQSQMGRISFNPANIELSSVVSEVAELSRDYARQKSIRISWNIPDNITFYADRTMVCIVLRNLVSNAIKFTNQGGNVVVNASHTPHEILFSVNDDGIGIDSATLGKLFRSDERFTSNGTQREMGTGLGLLLCKEFVEKHGGKIWVQSAPGRGSSFYFTIPVPINKSSSEI